MKEKVILKDEIAKRVAKKKIKEYYGIDTDIIEMHCGGIFRPKYEKCFYRIYVIITKEKNNTVIYTFNTYLKSLRYITTLFQ